MQLPKPLREPETTGNDAGFGLVEVLIAMLVFAIVAVSVAYSVTLTLSTTKDSKARQIALNLAAADIDAARAIGDPFKVFASTSTVVQGERYTVVRDVSWVSTGGVDAACSASGGTLRYKRVNVTVTWAGMGPTGVPARADTLIAPSSRINDPAKGTIFISVLGADGLGMPGIVPTITGSGSPTVDPTDSDGCAYVLGVTPGNYAVTLNKSGYIDPTQATMPKVPATGTIAVVAGQSTSFQFQYDKQSTFRTQYATNRPVTTPVTALKFPTNPKLDTYFVSTFGLTKSTASNITDSAAGIATAPNVTLFPFPEGYQAFVGDYTAAIPGNAGCQVSDPVAWAADTSTGTELIGQRGQGQSAAPGSPAANPIRIPMGIVQVKQPANNRTYLVAVRQTTPALDGQPVCPTPQSLRFGQILSGTENVRIALPFGSWKLYATSTDTATVTLTGPGANANLLTAATNITVLSNVIPGRNAADPTTGLITLDPRGITP